MKTSKQTRYRPMLLLHASCAGLVYRRFQHLYISAPRPPILSEFIVVFHTLSTGKCLDSASNYVMAALFHDVFDSLQ
jgi:hypothetical protein